VPQLVTDYQNKDNSFSRSIKRYGLDEKLTTGAKDFASHYSNYGSTLLDTGKRVAGVFISVLIILAVTFMMLVEGPRWLDRFFALMPKNKREHHKKLALRMYKAVSGFVNAQVIMAVLAGSFCLIALLIATNLLDVSMNVVALAGIVAMLGLIPMIGHPISSAIVLLVCLANSVELAIVMLIYFLVYYQVENLTVQPLIQSRLNELTPLLVFVAALIGVEFAGILGAFVAIPIATCIKVLLEDQLEQRGIRPTASVTK
jgi:predicted PurR-regulated permease PerM